MAKPPSLPSGLVERLGAVPTHAVLRELTEAARDAKVLKTKPFKRVVAYLLELADGRDRREPLAIRPGDAKPVPKLRLALEECFGRYADLHWFHLNRTANRAGKPLTGLHARMAATMWRTAPEDLGDVALALLAEAPDAALASLLQARGGRIRGMGLEVFARIAHAYRRDLYFVITKPWSESSGFVAAVGDDLRKYCALCRNVREACDRLGYPAAVRGSLVEHLLRQPKPPHDLLAALHDALGSEAVRYGSLDPAAAIEPGESADPCAMPRDFAFASIRARRGPRELRDALLTACGDRCDLSGACVRELLEAALVLPFPAEESPSMRTALLLRADLHTLWDMNLIGIEATTMRVYVAPRLQGTVYEKLAGRALPPGDGGPRLDPAALRQRWLMFAAAHPQDERAREDGPPPLEADRGRAEPSRSARLDEPAADRGRSSPDRSGTFQAITT
jgi:hypothetical protein